MPPDYSLFFMGPMGLMGPIKSAPSARHHHRRGSATTRYSLPATRYSLEFCRDAPLLDAIIRHREVWPFIKDDRPFDPEAVSAAPTLDSGEWDYLLVRKDAAPAGFLAFRRLSSTAIDLGRWQSMAVDVFLEYHACLLPATRGHGTAIARRAFDILRERHGRICFVARFFSTSEHVLRHVKRLGFHYFTEEEWHFTVDGKQVKMLTFLYASDLQNFAY
jgi:hypothetical protein